MVFQEQNQRREPILCLGAIANPLFASTFLKTKGNSQNFNIKTQQNPTKYNIIATPGSKNPIPKEPKPTNLAPLLNILIQHYKIPFFPSENRDIKFMVKPQASQHQEPKRTKTPKLNFDP